MEETSTLDGNDWFFLDCLHSDNCKGETLHSLKYNYTLPDFLKLKESVEILNDRDRALMKDEKAQNKTQR